MLMRKKVITRLYEKHGSWKCTCFGPWNSTIIYQNSRTSTIPTLNMIKINRYDNRGKYLQLRKKSVNRKTNRYLFTYLENRPKTRLHIALYDLYLTSTVLVVTAEVKYSSRKIAIKQHGKAKKPMTHDSVNIFFNILTFYSKICFKFCILEQIIAIVLFICISSVNKSKTDLLHTSVGSKVPSGSQFKHQRRQIDGTRQSWTTSAHVHQRCHGIKGVDGII